MAVAALVDDLYVRGLQDEVMVMAMGEFGRTPRINAGSGRDHWPDCYTVMVGANTMLIAARANPRK